MECTISQNKSKIRTIILDIINSSLTSRIRGCYLRSKNIFTSNDIDLWISRDSLVEFLTNIEMNLFDRHSIISRYELTHKGVIKILLKDEMGNSEHVDVWYGRVFKINGTRFHLSDEVLVSVNSSTHFLPNSIEYFIYLIHIIDRKKTISDVEQNKIHKYLNQDGALLECKYNIEHLKTIIPAKSVDSILEKCLSLGIIKKGSNASFRKYQAKKKFHLRAVIAVIGADGVGKTTNINQVKVKCESLFQKNKIIWIKFRRLYQKSWIYRRIRNFASKKIRSERTSFIQLEKVVALYSADLRIRLLTLFQKKYNILFIDRYFIDLALDRKCAPIRTYKSILMKSRKCYRPDAFLFLRAAPETIFKRKNEMDKAQVLSYYRVLFSEAFIIYPRFILSLSSECYTPNQTSNEITNFALFVSGQDTKLS